MICRPLTASSIPLNSTIDLLRANPAIPRLRLRLKTDPPTLAPRGAHARTRLAKFVRTYHGAYLSSRQYARIVHAWVESAGLDSSAYGTHSMRRTKAAQIYRTTGNLRAVQLLLGHTKLESTVRYLGIEVDDALSISEQVEL